MTIVELLEKEIEDYERIKYDLSEISNIDVYYATYAYYQKEAFFNPIKIIQDENN